jgi:CheY-like chemotaxis protein
MHLTDDASLTRIPPIIMVVDDEGVSRDTYAQLFSAEGWWVAVTQNSDEAFEYALDLRPDAIVADLSVRGGRSRGLELLRHMRAEPVTAATPVVVITDEPISGEAAAQLGIQTLLLKPASPAVLMDQVRDVLKRSRVLRDRSTTIRESIAGAVRRGQRAVARSEALRHRDSSAAQRKCPACGESLDWIETGTLDGITYDYYRACRRGCGHYCFDRRRQELVRLA